MENDSVARWRDARKTYGPVVALDGLDLALEPGRMTALLGPNGAGKTTAIRLLVGLDRPTRGTVSVFGKDPRLPRTRARMGVMMQNGQVPDTLKVKELFDLFRGYFPTPIASAELLDLTDLGSEANRLYGKLSGGQKQRVLFGLALAGDPELLLLDEPTVGMDVKARRGFWDRIRELQRRGRTILITTHYLEEAQALADRVAVLDRGVLLADTTASELRSRFGRKRIRLRSQQLSLEKLKSRPGVEDVVQDGTGWTLLCDRAEDFVRWVLDQDPELSDLEVHALDLEEAYLALTDAGEKGEEAISA